MNPAAKAGSPPGKKTGLDAAIVASRPFSLAPADLGVGRELITLRVSLSAF
jgi:hypothetical protein